MAVSLIAQIVAAVLHGKAGVERAWRLGLYSVTALAIGALVLHDLHMLVGSGATEAANGQARSDLFAASIAKWAGYSLLFLTMEFWILLAITSVVAKWSRRRAGASTSPMSISLV